MAILSLCHEIQTVYGAVENQPIVKMSISAEGDDNDATMLQNGAWSLACTHACYAQHNACTTQCVHNQMQPQLIAYTTYRMHSLMHYSLPAIMRMYMPAPHLLTSAKLCCSAGILLIAE